MNQLVLPIGFEPTISALRGRRPKPLDDGSICERLRRALNQLVLPIGFEPTISALRGRRPKPLDDGSVMAGVEGVEPSHTVPETAVLPLYYTPVGCLTVLGSCARRYIRVLACLSQALNQTFLDGCRASVDLVGPAWSELGLKSPKTLSWNRRLV